MSDAASDQADGLRRLLSAAPARVIAVAGMAHGVGVTTAAMNLGAALIRQGRQVVLLDEQGPTAQSVCAAWSIESPGTLDDVSSGRLGCDTAAALAPCGVKVLPAPPIIANAGFDIRSLCPAGVIVIDAALDGAGELSALAQRADELVIVTQPVASSITLTYAGLKRLHRAHGLHRFRFLVNDVAHPRQAQRLIDNIVTTSSRYLAVSLQPAGWIRSDPLLGAARRLSQTVLEAYPAGPAGKDFRRLALDLDRWEAPTAAAASASCAPGLPAAALSTARAGRPTALAA